LHYPFGVLEIKLKLADYYQIITRLPGIANVCVLFSGKKKLFLDA